MTEKNIFENTSTDVEIKVNDRVRILMRIDKVMDPNAFMEMMNSAKQFVKQNALIPFPVDLETNPIDSNELVKPMNGSSTHSFRSKREMVLARQQHVKLLLQKGLKNSQIALQLGVSPGTIKTDTLTLRSKGEIE